MRVYYIILSLLCSGFLPAWAQKSLPFIEQGPVSGQAKSLGPGIPDAHLCPYLQHTMAGFLDNGYLTYVNQSDQSIALILYRYDDELKLAAKEKVVIRYGFKNQTFKSILTQGNRIFVFGAVYDHKKNRKIIILSEIESTDLGKVVKQTELFSYTLSDKMFSDFWQVNTSPDGSKILISVYRSGYTKDDSDFHFWAYNSKMNPLWNKKVAYEVADGTFIDKEVMEVSIDRNDDVILQFHKFSTSPEQTPQKERKLSIHLWVLTDQGQRIQQYSFSRRNRYIPWFATSLAPNGELHCAGLYGGKDNSLEGIVKLVFSPEASKEPQSKYIDFKENELEPKWAVIKDLTKKEIKSIATKRIILRPDGGWILINNFQDLYSSYYRYGDVIVTSLNEEGEVEWCERIEIPDFAVFQPAVEANYAFFLQEDRLWFVYNEPNYVLRLLPERKRAATGERELDVKIVGLSPSGKRTEASLIPADQEGYTVDVFNKWLIDKNRLVLMGVKERKLYLTKINF
ncbi:MAG: hypothetical protein AAF927_22105 [Bacteroidota bacterium]